MEYQFIFIVIVGIISIVAGYWFTKRLLWLKLPVLLFGFLLLAISILPRLFPDYLYFLFPGHPYLEVVLAGAFMLTGVLAAHYLDTFFRLIIQGFLLFLMGYFILLPAGYLAIYADEIKSLNKNVIDGVTIQSGNFSCVPSSISTVLRKYGLEYTEGELAYALHTTPMMGTDYSRIPRVVRELGQSQELKARFIYTDLDELRKIDEYAVLIIYVGRIRHAVAFLGFENNHVILGDPLSGIRRIRADEFQEKTRWTKLAVIISKQA